ncbi:hypothetical protein BDN67DRAFT_1015355 [Paxillus ammoniavirescens]|nr:hypothetical protein BDN67DRAFT_1015355 [Paxillus ammoniavirescens]
MTDPLSTEPQTKNHTSADVHHFFKKCKGQETVCTHCTKMKEEDPDHFPSDRISILMNEYLTEADHNNWSIQIDAVKTPFSAGYTFTTLREALLKPGISIRALRAAPQPGPGDSPPELAGSPPFSLDAGLPSFSPPVFHHFLVRFIVADDQSLNVMECPEFRQLLLLLHQDLRDSQIPHCTKLHELVIDA